MFVPPGKQIKHLTDRGGTVIKHHHIHFWGWILKVTHRLDLMISFYKETEIQKGFTGSPRPPALALSGSGARFSLDHIIIS